MADPFYETWKQKVVRKRLATARTLAAPRLQRPKGVCMRLHLQSARKFTLFAIGPEAQVIASRSTRGWKADLLANFVLIFLDEEDIVAAHDDFPQQSFVLAIGPLRSVHELQVHVGVVGQEDAFVLQAPLQPHSHWTADQLSKERLGVDRVELHSPYRERRSHYNMPRSRSRSHRRSRKGRRQSSSSSSSKSSAHSHKRSHSREHRDDGKRSKRTNIEKIYKSPFNSSELVISSVLAGPALTRMITTAYPAVVDIDKTKATKSREDVGNMKLLLQSSR